MYFAQTIVHISEPHKLAINGLCSMREAMDQNKARLFETLPSSHTFPRIISERGINYVNARYFLPKSLPAAMMECKGSPYRQAIPALSRHHDSSLPSRRPSITFTMSYRQLTVISFVTAITATLIAVYAVV
jgi:hypothetical protein